MSALRSPLPASPVSIASRIDAAPRTEFRRYELKFWASERTVDAFLACTAPYLREDRRLDGALHQRNVSLYLDAQSYAFYAAHRGKAPDRYKLRLRSYVDVPEGETPVFVEVKRKVKQVSLKHRVVVPACAVPEVLAGRYPLDAVPPAHRRHFETFRYLQANYRAEPRLYVASRRTAFSSRTPGQDVRVTFDRELAYQPAHGLVFRPEAGAWRPLLAATAHPRWAGLAPVLIECKFRGAAPRWLGEATQRVGLARAAFSKYATAVERSTGRSA